MVLLCLLVLMAFFSGNKYIVLCVMNKSIVILVLLLFGSCRPSSKVSSQLKEPSPRDAILLTSIDKYKAYQTFDESKMEGVGTPQCQPFVLVFQRNDTALVRLSTDTTNIIMYVRYNSVITSHQKLPATGDYSTLSSENYPPREYNRWILNDTIIEVCSFFDDDSSYLFVKYPTKCYRCVLDISDYKRIDDKVIQLKTIMRRFKDILHGPPVLKRRNIEIYTIVQDKNFVSLKSADGEERVYRKNSLGKLAQQPGIENFDKGLSHRGNKSKFYIP